MIQMLAERQILITSRAAVGSTESSRVAGKLIALPDNRKFEWKCEQSRVLRRKLSHLAASMAPPISPPPPPAPFQWLRATGDSKNCEEFPPRFADKTCISRTHQGLWDNCRGDKRIVKMLSIEVQMLIKPFNVNFAVNLRLDRNN